ncbi:hypothetical protein WJX72_011024 [[Myrmecia] bisecta]|uniref:Tyrosine specific protein phosphatases domain-containing protein n=1 Tax=[Myrmecia] bisecta TaxID=41462 RepID=A0AAW1QSF5_9CHLO
MAGPTPWCNWVIKGQVLAGAYPASIDDAETVRILTTLLALGVNTFVCLQAEVNLNTPEQQWRKGNGLRPYIKDAQRLLTQAHERGNPLIKQQKIDFLHLPIIDGSVTTDAAINRLADDCCERVLRGEILYIHCWGGHGRTGTLVAIMLARLYHISCTSALKYTQAFHDARKYPQNVRSPQTAVQRTQVRRILAADAAKASSLASTASAAPIAAPPKQSLVKAVMPAWPSGLNNAPLTSSAKAPPAGYATHSPSSVASGRRGTSDYSTSVRTLEAGSAGDGRLGKGTAASRFASSTLSPGGSVRGSAAASLLNAKASVFGMGSLTKRMSLTGSTLSAAWSKHTDDTLPPVPDHEKYLIAALLHNSELILPDFIMQLMATLEAIPLGNAMVSIVESGSTDRTGEMLQPLQSLLAERSMPHRIITGGLSRQAGEERIQFLVSLRNEALSPLFKGHSGRGPWPADRIIYLNDVYYCASDVLRLIATKGDLVYGFDVHPYGALEQRGPAGEPFHSGLRFRSRRPQDCYACPESLLCEDLMRSGRDQFWMDPVVQVAYDHDEAVLLHSSMTAFINDTQWADIISAPPIDMDYYPKKALITCCDKADDTEGPKYWNRCHPHDVLNLHK